MSPIREYSGWNRRKTDGEEQIEPYRKYFIICEGANTENWYFKELINNRKQLGIHPTIELCLLEKTEEDRNLSNPKKLLKFAEEQKQKAKIIFDVERDKMILVFDADIFENKPSKEYDLFVEEGEKNNILAVSNPAFELFLLLHVDRAVELYILPNEKLIIQNKKEGKQRYISKLFREVTGKNFKKNPEIGKYAEKILLAIEQEKKINQDIHKCKSRITCNIGKIVEEIINDTL